MGLFQRNRVFLFNLSFSETDPTFPTASRRRAEDILVEINATYYIEVFSSVEHGFAVRGDTAVENIRAHPILILYYFPNSEFSICVFHFSGWAKEQSAQSIVSWFLRFSS